MPSLRRSASRRTSYRAWSGRPRWRRPREQGSSSYPASERYISYSIRRLLSRTDASGSMRKTNCSEPSGTVAYSESGMVASTIHVARDAPPGTRRALCTSTPPAEPLCEVALRSAGDLVRIGNHGVSLTLPVGYRVANVTFASWRSGIRRSELELLDLSGGGSREVRHDCRRCVGPCSSRGARDTIPVSLR